MVARDPKAFLLFVVQTIFIGAFGSTLFYNLNRDYSPGPDGQKLVNNRVGSIFFLCLNSYFGALTNTTFKMSKENSIIYKEIKSRMYTEANYFFSIILLDVIFMTLPVIIAIIPVSQFAQKCII